MIASLFENGGPMIAGKAIMKLTGVDCGPCRLPLTNLSEKSISKLKKVLKAKGFFAMNP
jgi:N-acetylneuraminate lyase